MPDDPVLPPSRESGARTLVEIEQENAALRERVEKLEGRLDDLDSESEEVEETEDDEDDEAEPWE